MSEAADARFMALALSLGRRGRGQAWPNPAVGCVIVRGERIVGRGWTRPGGRPHAEAVALAQAGDAAQGATAYVTLEPCAHASLRGPDCAGGLAAAGIARVVTALTDPDPRTAGQGHARLRAAGIRVESGLLGGAAAADLRGYLSRLAGGPAGVTLKLATTIDGRIATATGESRWITGPLARRDVHALRARHDGVLIGVGTALADDPELTVRDLGAVHQPVRIVADSGLRLPVESRLGQGAGRIPLWLVHGPAAPAARRADWAAAGARLIGVAAGVDGRLDVRAMLVALAGAGLNDVMCEGGAGLAAALIGAGCVQEVVLYQAGRCFGGGAVPAVAGLEAGGLLQGPAPFCLRDHAALGPDLRSRWLRADEPLPPG